VQGRGEREGARKQLVLLFSCVADERLGRRIDYPTDKKHEKTGSKKKEAKEHRRVRAAAVLSHIKRMDGQELIAQTSSSGSDQSCRRRQASFFRLWMSLFKVGFAGEDPLE